MMTRASGTFDVTLTPQPSENAIGRMVIVKQFHGDLEATSTGEMLAAGTVIPNSAGYVAMEKVIGTLEGRHGSFVLQHSGTMTRGAPELSVMVVPDSATDGLLGLSGTMAINIADGLHSYDFDYTIAAEPIVD